MKRTIRILIPILAGVLSACAARSGRETLDARVENRPLPLLDQGIPEELSRATFAMG